MDDLAPAPAQRISDDGGRRPEEVFSPRKKAPKKTQPEPAEKQDLEVKTEPDHTLDVLA
ncbi:MAG: hypothetical protein ABSF14_08510 [Terriglobia bacterium]|jgi:hypothetical protein